MTKIPVETVESSDKLPGGTLMCYSGTEEKAVERFRKYWRRDPEKIIQCNGFFYIPVSEEEARARAAGK